MGESYRAEGREGWGGGQIIMSRSECLGKCKDEPFKRGTAVRLAQGYKACYVCEICYHPNSRPQNPKHNTADLCYCCENKLRVKPVNKKKYRVLLEEIQNKR